MRVEAGARATSDGASEARDAAGWASILEIGALGAKTLDSSAAVAAVRPAGLGTIPSTVVGRHCGERSALLGRFRPSSGS